MASPALLVALSLAAAVPASRGPVPDITRTLREADWRDARREPMVGGGEVRLLRSGDDLYVAVTGPARGYPSLCVGDGRRVEILHASAALGVVSYAHAGQAWRLQAPFAWELREAAASGGPAAFAVQRDAFYRTHGWLSTASRQGEPTRMFRIRIEPARAWLGVVFLDKAAMRTTYWPASMGPACRNLPLVMGDPPSDLPFDPTGWSRLPRAGADATP